MQKLDHKRYASFDSPYLSLTVDKETAKLAFIGIEAGGRDRDKHGTYNLLLPGPGGMPAAFRKVTAPSAEI